MNQIYESIQQQGQKMISVQQLCKQGGKININLVEKSLINILSNTKYKQWSVGLQFISTNNMVQLNNNYRNKSKGTDILSFPFYEPIEPGLLKAYDDVFDLGDMYICLPYVKQQCIDNKWNIESRIPILLVHGICHLIGYVHETEKEYEQMQTIESELLKKYWQWRKLNNIQQRIME